MKTKFYLLLTALLTTVWSTDVVAQNIGLILAEDFDDGVLPTDWTRSQTAGSDGWTFGVTNVVADNVNTYWNVPASPDGSQFAISNDDLCNCTADDDQLHSPVMDWTGYDSVYVWFDYFYDQAFALSDAYFTLSYDGGTTWLYLPLTANATWVDDQLVITDSEIVINNVTYTFTDQMKIGFLHYDGDGWASGFAVDDLLIAGWDDPCEEIVNIPSCDAPQTLTLEGFGVVDWEFITGCGFTTFGDEQLYTFTPAVTGVHTLDVTSATGVSWLDYMYKPSALGCDTLNWICLGDANAPESYGMSLTAGVEYLILVDNEFIDSETQTFEISCPCTYTSLGGDPESEACGADLNGGCNNAPNPETWEPIACGQSISGTLWADGGNRDTDWFEIVVTENTDIVVDYSGAMPINAILVDDCAFTTVFAEATSTACGAGNITYAATPGTYILVLAPTAFEAYPCGSGSNDYDITVTYCEPDIDPCITASITYPDLNNAGGAPCSDINGCTPTDPDFQNIGLFGSEGYVLDNVEAGYDYVFDMCSGFGAGAWIPEITIVAPDGTTVDAWNGEAATGSGLTFLDQCSLGWTATQSGTYTIYVNQLGTAAGDAPNQVDCNTIYAVDNGSPIISCGANAAPCNPSTVDPCLTSADTWPDLNLNGGAPCNDGNGCTPTDPDFQNIGIYGSETYLLDNVQAGFDYVFDMCSGFGAGSWIPEIAIVAPDGTTVDAWNGEAASGSSLTFNDQCSLGWTATQSGTYSIIINQLGTAAGDAPNQLSCTTLYAVDNGNPTVLCGPNPAICLPCEAGEYTNDAEQDVCPGETALISLDGNQTSPTNYSIGFNSMLGGTGGLNGGDNFTITGFSLNLFPFNMDEDINGTLSANSAPPLVGSWVLTFYAVDSGVECDSTSTMVVNFLDANDPACQPTGIQEADLNSIAVYPNPSNGTFVFEMTGKEGNAQLVITDMVGRTVYSESISLTSEFRKEMNLNLPVGSYLMSVSDDDFVNVEKLQIK